MTGMTAALPGWRRLAVKLARHAAAGLPGASPWARAMRRELDYIENDRAALRWALGCVIASYKLRLAARMSGARRRDILRQAAASAALMLVTGLVLLENAGGQTAPPSPVLGETACDIADKGRNPDLNSDRTLPPVPFHAGLNAGRPAPASEMACPGRNAPVDVLPRYDTP